MMRPMLRARHLLAVPMIAAAASCAGVSPDPEAMVREPLPEVVLDEGQRARRDEWVSAAVDAIDAGRHESAEDAARSALALDPRSARARAAFGLCLQARARQQDPPDLWLQNQGDGETLRALRLSPADPVVGRLRARFLVGNGHLSAAAAAAEEVLAQIATLREDSLPTVEVVALVAAAAEYRYELGEEFLARGHLLRLVGWRPEDATAWYRLGVCQLTTAADVAGAVAAAASFRRCAVLSPGDLEAHLSVGTACFRAAALARTARLEETRREQGAAAIAAFAAAAERFPISGEPPFREALVQEAEGETALAAAAYGRALDRDPDHQGALLNLANLRRAEIATDPLARAAVEGLLRRVLALDDSGKSRLTATERRRIEAFLGGGQPGR